MNERSGIASSASSSEAGEVGRGGFEPPAYPYDLLDEIKAIAQAYPGGAIDLSVGDPVDPPPRSVVERLSRSGLERSYPPSVGTKALREAAAAWYKRRFGVDIDPGGIAACVGTKELVASLPWLLRLRDPSRDVVLCPEPAYPTYEMGARLGGCRAVKVPRRPDGTADIESLRDEDVERALVFWVNSPANPTGKLEDLATIAAWAKDRKVVVASDECYVEFTWKAKPITILSFGPAGVVALQSLSKSANLAGLRVGFYAGDPVLVRYLSEVRKHAGLMVPGPIQHAAVAALADDDHVLEQRRIYQQRLEFLSRLLSDGLGWEAPFPEGGIYVWARAASEGVSDGWGAARLLAQLTGIVASPGELYGASGPWVRVAAVAPMEILRLAEARLSAARA